MTDLRSVVLAAKSNPELGAERIERSVAEAKNNQFGAFIRQYHPASSLKGPLYGSAFSVKDNIAVANEPLSYGLCPPLIEKSPADSEVVLLFQKLGAALVGSNNLDAGCIGAYGFDSVFQEVKHPLQLANAPGGSSSGSAVSVKAGVVDFSIGSDSGGSMRIPAAACELWGLKCGHLILPRKGSILLQSIDDSLGLFTNNGQDLLFILETIECSSQTTGNNSRRTLVIPNSTEYSTLDQRAQQSFESIVKRLDHEFQIAQLEDVDYFLRSVRVRKILAAQDTEALLKKLNYSHPLPASLQLLRTYAATITPQMVEQVTADRETLSKQMEKVLQADTLLMTPSLPGPLLTRGTQTVNEIPPNHFLCLANTCGLPALSLPIPHANFSIQLIGPPHSESTLAHFGLRIHSLFS